MIKSILLIIIKSVILFLFLLISGLLKAQVPTWTGTSVFKEDFGGRTTDPANMMWLIPGSSELTTWSLEHPGIINLDYVETKGTTNTEYGILPLNFTPSSYAVSKLIYRIDNDNTNIAGGDYADMTDHTSTDGSGYFVTINPSGNDSVRTPIVLYQQEVDNVSPGTLLSFTGWFRNIRKWSDGITPLILKVTGTSLDQSTGVTLTGGDDWTQYGFEFEAGTNNNVTISILADVGISAWSGWKYAFAMDDIEVRQKDPISIISPIEVDNAISGENVLLEANYEYGVLGDNLIYRWEKSTDENFWTAISGSDGISSNGAITASYNVTGNNETVYYRLAVTKNTDSGYTNAVYSGTITVVYTSILLTETFGGCGVSNPFIITPDNTYLVPGYAYVGGYDPLGQPNVYATTYVITKNIYQNTWNDGGTQWKTNLSDHTVGCDGYFLQAHAVKIVENSVPVTFYEKENVPVTPGNYYSFYVSIANPGDNPVNFQLKVTYDNGTTDEGQTGVIQGATGSNDAQWERYVHAFKAPAGVSSATFTIEPVPFNAGDAEWPWGTVFAMDDISVSLLSPSVTISSPESGTQVCSGDKVSFSAEYATTFASAIYKWQYRSTETDTWTDITGASGALSSLAGKIIYSSNSLGSSDSGFYRVLVADAGDTGYTNAIGSKSIELEVTARVDDDLITVVQTGGCLEGSTSLKASASVPSPIFMWYLNESVYATNTNEITLPASGVNIPTSGTFTYDFNITLQYADLCESLPKNAPMVINNCRAEEDFRTGSNEYLLQSEIENAYTIPGYNYAGQTLTDVPNLNPRNFIFTKKIYLQTWDGGGANWNTQVTDHTGNNGYFLQVHTDPITDTDPVEFYKTTGDVLPNSKISFTVWINKISLAADDQLQFRFRIVFVDSAGEKVGEDIHSFPVMEGYSPDWRQLEYSFFVPQNSAKAIYTIEADTSSDIWEGHRAFAMDDIEIEKLAPVQIAVPESSKITVFKNSTVDLEGLYAFEGNPPTDLVWQKLTNGTWVDVTGSNNSLQFTTEPILGRTYYRLTVIHDGVTYSSNSVEIMPVTLSDLAKTYFVCPDNMTDKEANERRYLPSLIRMEVDELYGVTYKWYDVETGGLPLPDEDEYAPGNTSLVSDGETYTLSALNERNTEGLFQERVYWVEVYDNSGVIMQEGKRFSVTLSPGYLCGSLDAEISTATSRRLYRGDFGGKGDNDPDILRTPLSGIDYIQDTRADEIGEGYYRVGKSTESDNTGWAVMTDHIYEGIANEKHGYLLAVNANQNPGRFYTHQIDNLGSCRNIELVFTGWFASFVNWEGDEKANLKFKLTDTDSGEVLAEFLTGNMIDAENKWRQYGFRFFVPEGVTSLTLEVVNNNYGTQGGNDVVLDDIEVYLAMPPVDLEPAENTVVCETTSITLSGAYEDDGTLGLELDYRWEYRKDENSPWEAITDALLSGQNISKSIDNGIITFEDSKYEIKDFGKDNEGDYRLAVGKRGAFNGTPNYDCMAVSEPRKLTLADESVSPILQPSLQGNTAYCMDDVMEISTVEGNENVTIYSKYAWYLDEGQNTQVIEENDNYNGAPHIELKLELATLNLTPGFHKLIFTASNSAGYSASAIHEFLVYPEETTWIAEGDPNNWNDAANWSDGIPGKCTDVTIPNKDISMSGTTLLEHYPLLLKPTVETLNSGIYENDQVNLGYLQTGKDDTEFSLRPACNNITFKMGGAVARTDYLDYNYAFVDLDINPERWYMVSAPLRSMYSGDYFAEGSLKRRNPMTYMMKYNTNNPQTGASPIKQTGDFSNSFNTLTEELHPGLGFAIWVDPGTQSKNELQSFRFPKDSLEYAMWTYSGDYVRTVSIPSRSNINRFTYESRITMNGTLPGNQTEFTVEVKDDKDTYTTTIVGNPFMSHLDFGMFASKNNISGGYYIWDGSSYSAFNPAIFIKDPNEIAPMQAFVVEKTGVIEDFTFAMDMSVKSPDPVNVGSVIRSDRLMEEAVLQMEVIRDSIVHSNIRLKYEPMERNTYDKRKDMWTLFSENIKTPAILYSLLDGKAASVRTIGDLTVPIELGIRTIGKGLLTLRMSGQETYDKCYHLYLEDRLLGIVQDMRKTPEYTFDNQIGNVEGRFFLNMSEEPIEGKYKGKSSISIWQENCILNVKSSLNDPIRTVMVYSVQGKLLHKSHTINASEYNVTLPFKEQVFIVSVTTELTWKNDKIRVP